MKHSNIYPVSFKDFLSIKAAGNYILTYTLLDDRIHLELAVENSVYATQRFYTSITEEINQKGSNYLGSHMKIFMDMYFNSITAYRYYATEKEIEYLKSIKLYSKLVIEKVEDTKLTENLVIIEYDDKIVTKSNEKKVLIIRKVM